MASVWEWLKKWGWVVISLAVVVIGFLFLGRRVGAQFWDGLSNRLAEKILDADARYVEARTRAKVVTEIERAKIESLSQIPDPRERRDKIAEMLKDL
jgi:hypothetical protein